MRSDNADTATQHDLNGRPPRVLFLCTGNYYRSRFAELLFNDLAREAGIAWRAASRGVAIELGKDNLGAVSPWAVGRLAARGRYLPQPARRPRQVEAEELAEAGRIVALKETEHRHFLAERFPGWEERVEYWHVDDLDVARPGEALARLESRVRQLIADLATHSAT